MLICSTIHRTRSQDLDELIESAFAPRRQGDHLAQLGGLQNRSAKSFDGLCRARFMVDELKSLPIPRLHLPCNWDTDRLRSDAAGYGRMSAGTQEMAKNAALLGTQLGP